MSQDNLRPIQYIQVREEYVALTKDFVAGAILGYFIGWQKYVRHVDRYFAEEAKRLNKFSDEPYDPEGDYMKAPSGWVYKTTEQIQKGCFLNNQHKTTTAKIVDSLVESGWLMRRRNPKIKYDRTYQYRVDLVKIKKDLSEIGYALHGWTELKEYEPKETNNDTGGSKPITSEVQKTLHACSEKPHMHMRETLLHKSENATTIPIDLRQQIQENNNNARETKPTTEASPPVDASVVVALKTIGLNDNQIAAARNKHSDPYIAEKLELLVTENPREPVKWLSAALRDNYRKVEIKPVTAISHNTSAYDPCSMEKINQDFEKRLNNVSTAETAKRYLGGIRKRLDVNVRMTTKQVLAEMISIPLSANNQLT